MLINSGTIAQNGNGIFRLCTPLIGNPSYTQQTKRLKLDTTSNLYKMPASTAFPKICEQLDKATHSSDDYTIGKPTDSDLNIGYYNVRGPLSTIKLDYICWLFLRKKLHILFLLDTQLAYESAMYIKREIKARLGFDTKVIATDNKLQNSQQGVGGQMVICSSFIKQQMCVKSDESGLGIYLGLGIRMQNSWLWAIGVY